MYIELESVGGLIGGETAEEADHAVIHSLWVAEARRQAGRRAGPDERAAALNAFEPGTYWGQCAEFCGLQHGLMKFRVVALEQADWEAWVANQQQPAVEPTEQLGAEGAATCS